MSKYIVSVGDSDKYAVDYAGNKKEFMDSDVYKEIKEKIEDYLQKEFPAGGFSAVDVIKVEEGGGEYEPLTADNFRTLLDSAKRQAEVLSRTNEQNLNAPFDQD